MTPVRRIALVLSTAAVSVALIGATAPAANADITWGYMTDKGQHGKAIE